MDSLHDRDGLGLATGRPNFLELGSAELREHFIASGLTVTDDLDDESDGDILRVNFVPKPRQNRKTNERRSKS